MLSGRDMPIRCDSVVHGCFRYVLMSLFMMKQREPEYICIVFHDSLTFLPLSTKICANFAQLSW
jgi:hypothetical protein